MCSIKYLATSLCSPDQSVLSLCDVLVSLPETVGTKMTRKDPNVLPLETGYLLEEECN